jgi:Tol biopolymer transport system component
MKISTTSQALGQLAAMLSILCSTACGRRGELLGTIASAPDGASPGAGGASTPRFSQPQLVASVSDPLAYDADPTVTGDLLEMFFFSDRSGSRDIWTSHRLSATDPWGAPTSVSELNSAFPEEGPSISLDGRRIWFVTDRDGLGRNIWRSSRSGRGAPWAAPQPVTELAGSGNDLGPSLDAAETTVFFATSRAPSMGGYDLFFSTRVNTSASWAVPRPIPGLNSSFDEKEPFVAQGGLVVFFTSSRAGVGDLFWSERQSTTEPFPVPVPLVDLNSPSTWDSDPSLSQDLTYILFDSERSGISDIYEAHSIP